MAASGEAIAVSIISGSSLPSFLRFQELIAAPTLKYLRNTSHKDGADGSYAYMAAIGLPPEDKIFVLAYGVQGYSHG